MSKVVFALTDAQYRVLADVANRGGALSYGVPRIFSTAEDLVRKGWLRPAARSDLGRPRFELTRIGLAVVALANALAAASASAAVSQEGNNT
jgi:hypothetical protein